MPLPRYQTQDHSWSERHISIAALRQPYETRLRVFFRHVFQGCCSTFSKFFALPHILTTNVSNLRGNELLARHRTGPPDQPLARRGRVRPPWGVWRHTLLAANGRASLQGRREGKSWARSAGFFTLSTERCAAAGSQESVMSHSLRIGGLRLCTKPPAGSKSSSGRVTTRWTSSAAQRCLHDGKVVLKHNAKNVAQADPRIHYALLGAWPAKLAINQPTHLL